MKRKVQETSWFWQLATIVLMVAWLSSFFAPDNEGFAPLPSNITIADVLLACGVDVDSIGSIDYKGLYDDTHRLTPEAFRYFMATDVLTQVFSSDVFEFETTVFAGSYLLIPNGEADPAKFSHIFAFANQNRTRQWFIVYPHDYMMTDETTEEEACGKFEIDMHG